MSAGALGRDRGSEPPRAPAQVPAVCGARLTRAPSSPNQAKHSSREGLRPGTATLRWEGLWVVGAKDRLPRPVAWGLLSSICTSPLEVEGRAGSPGARALNTAQGLVR